MTDEPTGLPPQTPPDAAPPVAPPPSAPAPAAPPAQAAPVYAPPAQAAPPAYAPAPGPAAARPGPMPGVYFAGHPGRLIAWIIDGFILSIIATLLMAVVFILGAAVAQGSEGLGGTIIALGWFLVALVAFLWFPYWWSKNGQTPGMKMMHVKVVNAADGNVISFGKGILRYIGLVISFWALYIGVIWILIDPKRQGWADKIAGTYVIDVA